MKKKILAIIPARSGSKRIKNKNIKKFNGQPIISEAIRILKVSKIFDNIVVTTNSKRIAKISINSGANVPFLRSQKLADDYTDIITVIKNAIKNLQKKKRNFDYVCVVYPTSIFNNKKKLLEGLTKLKTGRYDFVFSAVKGDQKFFRSFVKLKNQFIKMNFSNMYSKRSQDLPEIYNDAAQFYWAKTSTWLKNNKIFTRKSTFVEMSDKNVIDIDQPQDFKKALSAKTL